MQGFCVKREGGYPALKNKANDKIWDKQFFLFDFLGGFHVEKNPSLQCRISLQRRKVTVL